MGNKMIPYVYYVYDHDTDKTMYITEELDDAREWIDEPVSYTHLTLPTICSV